MDLDFFDCIITQTLSRDIVTATLFCPSRESLASPPGGDGTDQRSRIDHPSYLQVRVTKGCPSQFHSPPHLRADVMVSPKLFSNYTRRNAISGSPAIQEERNIDTANVFEHTYKHLADYRNLCQVYHVRAYEKQNPEIDAWANDLLKTLWTATTARDPGWCRPPSSSALFQVEPI